MSNTLLLNSNYEPISVLPLSVINWQHSIKLYFLDRVTILESYDDWVIHSEHLSINVPSVCVTKEYFNYKKAVKFSRTNMYLRDLYTCQYCDETFPSKELTIDHVVPRMAGGMTNWENCTTSCKPCNHHKGSKLRKPMRMPYKPDYYSLVSKWKNRKTHVPQESWYKYLGITPPDSASVDTEGSYLGTFRFDL